MTIKEILKNDNSYLTVFHKTSNIFSKEFWKNANKKGYTPIIAGTNGNQREAYEDGIKYGWEKGFEHYAKSMYIPSNVYLSEREYNNIIEVLKAFGVQFMYVPYISGPVDFPDPLRPGLNIIKSKKAYLLDHILTEPEQQEIIGIIRMIMEGKAHKDS